MSNYLSEFTNFYDSTLGSVALRYIRGSVIESWKSVNNQNLLGIGFSEPYLSQFVQHAHRIISVVNFPSKMDSISLNRFTINRSLLAEELNLPFSDESMDKVLIVHSLEHSKHVHNFLREVWRVLSPNGSILLVVPNRRGIWSQNERTPFGHGQPYGIGQLNQILMASLFTPIKIKDCLYTPPLKSEHLMRLAPAFESFGVYGFRVGGVLIAEAIKQIYAVSPLVEAASKKREQLI